MNITDVRVRTVNTESNLKAVASITIDDAFVVHDIKLIQGEHGFFIGMPSRKDEIRGFRDVAHPITTEARNQISELIISEYEKV